MATKATSQTSLQFGTYQVDLASQELFRRGVPLHLHGKPFQILALLLERPGEIVTREQLGERLWPDGTFVDFDRNLNTAIKKLRQALGDSAETPVFIETLPRRGYRFIAPVNLAGNGQPTEPSPTKRVDIEGAEDSCIDHRALSGRLLVLIVVSVLIAALIALVVNRLLPREEALDVRKMRFARVTNSGNIREMAISPDGQYLAYAITLGLEQSLWIRNLSGANTTQLLAADTVNFSGISFSPDGAFLYFIRSEKTNPVFSYMCRMPALGGKVEELIRDADSPASFSPDGNRIVYTRGYPPRNTTQVRIADGDGGHDHALIELDGHQVFEAGAVWSPDGKRIAVPIHLVGEQSKFVLYVIALSDGKPQNIFSSEGDIGRPLWISNSKLLVTLRTGYGQGGQLWTVSYPDGASERFTNDLTDYSSAVDFSRDKKRLAVIANSLASDVWVAASDDLLHPNQITSGVPSALSVRWLNDERVVMLVSSIEPPPLRARELPTGRTTSEETAVWSMNADGTHRKRWVGIENPEWIEPCGNALEVLANRAGNTILLRYENESVQPKALASGDVLSPACSPDGTITYFLNLAHPEKIRRISNQDGSTTDIADVLGDTVFGSLAISPDGDLLAYPYQRYSPPRVAIAVIPARGGSPIKEFTIPGFSEMLRWSPDGRSLQYLLTNDGVTNLWEQALNEGKARQLTRFNAGHIFDFTWTRDAKHLLMARGASTTDVVLIDDPN